MCNIGNLAAQLGLYYVHISINGFVMLSLMESGSIYNFVSLKKLSTLWERYIM